ncbi:Origin recognition complex, subunit 1, partial [Spiromyces aspiralis]
MFASPTIREGATAYEIARQRLHVSAVPDTLPCREDEFAEILMYLQSALDEGGSLCLYISGVPGAGKTATVREVIRTLQESADQGDVPPFKYTEINGMKLTDPAQAYVLLWRAIKNSDERITPSHAAQLLDQHFSQAAARGSAGGGGHKQIHIVLMDELDLLVTKNQAVIYNLFDWPYRPNARLIVIAIANTMDLPERMLSHKVSSRLGLTRVNFQPYTYQQLYTIVTSRLEGCEAFDPDAIEFCARKVSA